mmetsp:Transcript_37071/g.106761  ORF Transcript_37071/g.106761 Transcript_37071/m.106761 type:complete len:219 (+) Transcript_37071:495-1151(+)
MARFSCMYENPVTSSSMVSSPDSSMSKVSHVRRRSVSWRWMPCAFMVCFICGWVMRCSNSSLSSTRFPSVSAFTNSAQRKLEKLWRWISWSIASCSFLVVEAEIMVSEATAVRRLSMVQDMNTMKQMKKPRSTGATAMTEFWILDQSSAVVSWKSVKRDLGMSAKYSMTCSKASESPEWPSRPWATRLVSTMAITKQRMKTMLRIHTKVFIMPSSSFT